MNGLRDLVGRHRPSPSRAPVAGPLPGPARQRQPVVTGLGVRAAPGAAPRPRLPRAGRATSGRKVML